MGDEQSRIVLARISASKCLLFAVASLALGIPPMLPGFSQGLTYTVFLYTTAIGTLIRWAAFVTLLLIASALLFGAMLVIFGSSQAVWINGRQLCWGRIGTKRVSLSEITKVQYQPARQAIVLSRLTGKPLAIPTL